MNRKSAAERGWEFEVVDEDGVARKVVDGETVDEFQVTSRTPVFSMLREIAAREGEPIDDDAITPALVKRSSGETYKPDEPLPVDE